MPLPLLKSLTLNTHAPERLVDFYCDVLGMQRLESENTVTVGYENNDVSLKFQSCDTNETYRHAPTDRYWKIAITLPDLDAAYTQLRERGIKVTAPQQFRDIAYMSHLSDPSGHVIELLQHTFDGNPKSAVGDPSRPLGGGARVGLITLRTDDIDAELQVCRQALGMRYLSRQDVPDLNFCLHFLAFTDETQPDPDINAVRNREWLWQRPYTVLEFQERPAGPICRHSETEVGAACVRISMGQKEDRIFR